MQNAAQKSAQKKKKTGKKTAIKKTEEEVITLKNVWKIPLPRPHGMRRACIFIILPVWKALTLRWQRCCPR